MADNKPLVIDETTGCQEEVIPLIVSTGAPDASMLVQTNGAGKIDETLLPDSVFDAQSFTSAEALSAGDFVYIDSSGEAALASAASAGNKAVGFVKDTVIAAAPVTVYFEGKNDAVAGLTPGTEYFLSGATPGAVVTSASLPSATGELVQKLGVATAATCINFEPDLVGIRA